MRKPGADAEGQKVSYLKSPEQARPRHKAAAAAKTRLLKELQPSGGGPPAGLIADCIKDSFGDYAKFCQEFTTAATTQLGSGWV